MEMMTDQEGSREEAGAGGMLCSSDGLSCLTMPLV